MSGGSKTRRETHVEETLVMQWLKENDVGLETNGLSPGFHWHGKCLMELIKNRQEPVTLQDYRKECIRQFSWALLDRATVNALLPHGPFLELGCGTGYWSHEIRLAGGDSLATDPNPYRVNGEEDQESTACIYSPLRVMDAHETLETFGATGTLLLVWPTLGDSWPRKALRQYGQLGGKKVVYVGEGNGGCTADDSFHELLDGKWEQIEEIRIPWWAYIRDYCVVYKRK